MPVGGACAVMGQSYGKDKITLDYVDPELEEFKKKGKYIQENLKCDIEFLKSLIPSEKGRITGVMVVKARKDIEHNGIFVLIKGQTLTENKPQKGKKPLAEIRFMVIKPTKSEGGERVTKPIQINAGSKDTYPVELDIPKELPLPVLNSRGSLMYRVHTCVYPTMATKKRHVVVGECSLRWLGFHKLELEEVKNELRIEQLVQNKRGMMGLGRRKSATLEWKLAKSGYLPGEKVHIELWEECKDKDGLGIECKVELLQKVLYQVPSGVRSMKMTQMKVNVLASEGTKEAVEIMSGEADECKKILIWRGKLKVPRGITPTMKFDFMNSVSYMIRTSAGIAGETRECWVTAEVPVLIGTSKVIDDDNNLDGKSDEDDDEEADYDTGDMSPSPKSASSSCNAGTSTHRPRSESRGAHMGPSRSHSMGFIPGWTRPRSGSVSSMESLASSTLSIFRLPPSHSQQLSSRRPSLETLSSAYSELDLHAQATPSIVAHQQTERDTYAPDMLKMQEVEGSEEDAKTKHDKANYSE